MKSSNLTGVKTVKKAINRQVIIVEDDALFASELHILVEQEAGYEVCAMANSFSDAKKLVEKPHDLLVVDIGLPDGSGIDLVKTQKECQPMSKALVMTVFDDRVTTTQAFAAGADGYVLKTDAAFASRLHQVMGHQTPIDAAVAGYLVDAVRVDQSSERQTLPGLTDREHQTLEGLARGLSYQEIATDLEISPHTVTDYIKGIYRKLQVRSRSAAVYIGLQQGLILLGQVSERNRRSSASPATRSKKTL